MFVLIRMPCEMAMIVSIYFQEPTLSFQGPTAVYMVPILVKVA
jgi:hypothetical protein